MSKQSLLATLALAVAACNSTTPKSDPLQLVGRGGFSYRATTLTGQPLLEGTMTLEWSGDSTASGRPFSGVWTIQWAAGADQNTSVGPQVGTGTLDGIAQEAGVTISLNPAMLDNNVILHARVDGHTLIGNWIHSTLAGPTTQGHFAAENTR